METAPSTVKYDRARLDAANDVSLLLNLRNCAPTEPGVLASEVLESAKDKALGVIDSSRLPKSRVSNLVQGDGGHAKVRGLSADMCLFGLLSDASHAPVSLQSKGEDEEGVGEVQILGHIRSGRYKDGETGQEYAPQLWYKIKHDGDEYESPEEAVEKDWPGLLTAYKRKHRLKGNKEKQGKKRPKKVDVVTNPAGSSQKKPRHGRGGCDHSGCQFVEDFEVFGNAGYYSGKGGGHDKCHLTCETCGEHFSKQRKACMCKKGCKKYWCEECIQASSLLSSPFPSGEGAERDHTSPAPRTRTRASSRLAVMT